MSKRKLSDFEAEDIVQKKQYSTKLDQAEYEKIEKCSFFVQLFFDAICDCINENLSIDIVLFKKFMNNSKIFNLENERIQINEYFKNIDKKTYTFFYQWFFEYLKENENNENYSYCVLYVCYILRFCMRNIINRFSTLFYLIIDKELKKNEREIRNLFLKLDLEITFPYLHLLYEYNSEDIISDIALRKISESDYRLLCQKHGDNFFIKSLYFYIEKIGKWSWKPDLTFSFKKKILNTIDDLYILKKCFDAKLVTMSEVISLIQLGICKLDNDIMNINSYIDLFKDLPNFYGKYARLLKSEINLYSPFIERPYLFTEYEQSQLIKHVVPINMYFFDVVTNREAFSEGLKEISRCLLINLTFNINDKLLERIGVTEKQMKEIISDRFREIDAHYLGNRDHQMIDYISNFNLTFEQIYYFSDYIISKRSRCLVNESFFNYFLISMAFNNLNVVFTHDEKQIMSRYFNYIENIKLVVNALRTTEHYVKYTNRIFWVIDNIFFSIIYQGIARMRDNSLFSGVNLVWNKMNTIYIKLLSREPDGMDLLNILEIFENNLPNGIFEELLYCNMFIFFDYFCRKKSYFELERNVFWFISENHNQILIKHKRMRYLVFHYLFEYEKHEFEKQINSIISQEEDKESKKEELYKNIGFKQCCICFDYSEYMIKLNCECNYDFCASCISEMRFRKENQIINCPTCRKLSGPDEDIVVYNKLST